MIPNNRYCTKDKIVTGFSNTPIARRVTLVSIYLLRETMDKCDERIVFDREATEKYIVLNIGKRKQGS